MTTSRQQKVAEPHYQNGAYLNNSTTSETTWVMSRALLRVDRRLPWNAKLVWLALADRWPNIEVGVSTIAEECGISIRTAFRAVRILQEESYCWLGVEHQTTKSGDPDVSRYTLMAPISAIEALSPGERGVMSVRHEVMSVRHEGHVSQAPRVMSDRHPKYSTGSTQGKTATATASSSEESSVREKKTSTYERVIVKLLPLEDVRTRDKAREFMKWMSVKKPNIRDMPALLLSMTDEELEDHIGVWVEMNSNPDDIWNDRGYVNMSPPWADRWKDECTTPGCWNPAPHHKAGEESLCVECVWKT